MENPTINNTSATADTFGVRCSNPASPNLSAVADLIFNKMEQEIWKEVKGFEGYYEISNLGRVKSLSRMAHSGCCKWKTKERLLKSALIKGYPHVNLCKGGIRNPVMVHVLVAIAFLGHTPNANKMDVDHINGIKPDPRVENLRIVTHRFNCTHGFRKNKDSLSSQYSGVNWHKGAKKWRSAIKIDGKQKYLGLFDSEIDASNAYQDALSKI